MSVSAITVSNSGSFQGYFDSRIMPLVTMFVVKKLLSLVKVKSVISQAREQT